MAIVGVREDLVVVIEIISDVLVKGGRFFYIGVGISGWLGVLDVVECFFIFCILLELVQGILVGGVSVLFCSLEGLEDIVVDGVQAIVDYCIIQLDVVVGIMVGGMIFYVYGVLDVVRVWGMKMIFIVCVLES